MDRSCLDENEAFLTTADSAVKLLPAATKPITGWRGLEYRTAFPMQKPPGANFYPPDMDKMVWDVSFHASKVMFCIAFTLFCDLVATSHMFPSCRLHLFSISSLQFNIPLTLHRSLNYGRTVLRRIKNKMQQDFSVSLKGTVKQIWTPSCLTVWQVA